MILAGAFLAAATVAAPPVIIAPPVPPGWREYRNARFAYSICYPPGLAPQPEADNGDGRLFLARDGARLAVWGGYDADRRGLAASLAQDAARLTGARGRVTYRAVGRDAGVVSGLAAERLFYVKTLLRGDRTITFELSYPQRLAARYRPVVESLARCFVAG